MSTVTEEFKHLEELLSKTRKSLDRLQKAIAETPNLEAISELVSACEQVEESYREGCEDTDAYDDLPSGTTREEGGYNAEFYINHDEWGNASKALEQLKDLKQFNKGN